MLFSSLSRTLILILTSLIVLIITVATLQAYRITLLERQHAHDVELAHIASLLLQTQPQQHHVKIKAPLFVRQKIHDTWYESPDAPHILPEHSGYHEIMLKGTLWRVLKLQQDVTTVVVGFPKEVVFNELEALILPTITPFLVALPVLGVVIFVVVRFQLRPLKQLDKTLTKQEDFQFTPLHIENAFLELQPVILTINKLMSRLKASYEREQSFSANVAHELKTPLTTLSLTIDNLIADAASHEQNACEKRKQSLENMQAHLLRVNSVVESLLLMAKTHPHFYRKSLTRMNILPIIQETLSALFPKLNNKQQSLSFDYAQQSYCLDTSPTLISIVIDNLVLNAHKYCHEGAQIIVELTQQAAQMSLTVRDDGQTVTEETINHLSERFVRGSQTHISGSGLGLSIVQQIMDIHHGTMTVSIDSKLGGLNITCIFPNGTPPCAV